MFNRSPRVEARYPGTAFKGPRLPKEMVERIFPWPMLVTPILLAGAMFAMRIERGLFVIANIAPASRIGVTSIGHGKMRSTISFGSRGPL